MSVAKSSGRQVAKHSSDKRVADCRRNEVGTFKHLPVDQKESINQKQMAEDCAAIKSFAANSHKSELRLPKLDGGSLTLQKLPHTLKANKKIEWMLQTTTTVENGSQAPPQKQVVCVFKEIGAVLPLSVNVVGIDNFAKFHVPLSPDSKLAAEMKAEYFEVLGNATAGYFEKEQEIEAAKSRGKFIESEKGYWDTYVITNREHTQRMLFYNFSCLQTTMRATQRLWNAVDYTFTDCFTNLFEIDVRTGSCLGTANLVPHQPMTGVPVMPAITARPSNPSIIHASLIGKSMAQARDALYCRKVFWNTPGASCAENPNILRVEKLIPWLAASPRMTLFNYKIEERIIGDSYTMFLCSCTAQQGKTCFFWFIQFRQLCDAIEAFIPHMCMLTARSTLASVTQTIRQLNTQFIESVNGLQPTLYTVDGVTTEDLHSIISQFAEEGVESPTDTLPEGSSLDELKKALAENYEEFQEAKEIVSVILPAGVIFNGVTEISNRPKTEEVTQPLVEEPESAGNDGASNCE